MLEQKSRNGISQFGLHTPAMVRSLHTPQYEQFRLLIADARERAKLTQAELAARLGKPQSFVSKYESGERRLDVVEFILVCNALEVEPGPILNRLIKVLHNENKRSHSAR